MTDDDRKLIRVLLQLCAEWVVLSQRIERCGAGFLRSNRQHDWKRFKIVTRWRQRLFCRVQTRGLLTEFDRQLSRQVRRAGRTSK